MHLKEITFYNWDDPRNYKNVGRIQLTPDSFKKIKDYELSAIQSHGLTTFFLSKNNEDVFSAVSNSANNFKAAFDKIEEQMKIKDNELLTNLEESLKKDNKNESNKT